MNRGMKTAIEILGITAIFVIASIIAYKIGEWQCPKILGNFVNVRLDQGAWLPAYLKLVAITGTLAWLAAMFWYAMTRWGTTINYPFGVGKRTVWAILGVLAVVVSVAAPLLIVSQTLLRNTGLNMIIHASNVLVFGVLGYYLSTLLFTPASYKYTPLGAEMVRGTSRRKGA